MDLAFFVVRVGLSPSEYRSLSETEKIFIRKEHENNFKEEKEWLRNAVLNANANLGRKKNSAFQELFNTVQRADKEYNQKAIATIEEMEQENGKSWVDKIYQANGLTRKG